MVARFGEKVVNDRKLSGVVCWPERGHHSVLATHFGEGGFRDSCVGGRPVTVLVARFRVGEKDVPERLRVGRTCLWHS